MGMKKKEDVTVGKADIQVGSTLPPIPTVPLIMKSIVKAVEQKERAGDDKMLSEKMTKADWGAKDRSIAMLALIADVYKSPVVAQQSVGLNQADVFALIDKHFAHALNIYESNK